MVAIPTIKDEDAKRPHRERESLVREQTRIVNRMKTGLAETPGNESRVSPGRNALTRCRKL
jgi:transposase